MITRFGGSLVLSVLALCSSCSSGGGGGGAAPTVTIASATPGIIQGGDTSVPWVLTGTGFEVGLAVSANVGGVTVDTIDVVSPTEVRFNVTAPAGLGTGMALITVVNPDTAVANSPVVTVPETITLSGDVQPIFTASCATASCHDAGTPAAGLDLSAGNAHAAIFNVASAQEPALFLADAGDPDASYLVDKIEGTQTFGGRMPLGGAPLATTSTALVRKWIEAGALND